VNQLWGELDRNGIKIHAPRLWVYEVTSIIRKLVVSKKISREFGRESLSLLLDSNIQFVDDNNDLVLAAYRWAVRLEKEVVNDCFYIALAEQMDADFWSTDKRLINRLKEIGWPNIKELPPV
jgi:predicted nucleic acid-binding protein